MLHCESSPFNMRPHRPRRRCPLCVVLLNDHSLFGSSARRRRSEVVHCASMSKSNNRMLSCRARCASLCLMGHSSTVCGRRRSLLLWLRPSAMARTRGSLAESFPQSVHDSDIHLHPPHRQQTTAIFACPSTSIHAFGPNAERSQRQAHPHLLSPAHAERYLS